MARPKEFDEQRAVDAAMRTFWVNGYEATSTQDLCAATGLGRSSIYNTFESKHNLFRRALLRYMELMNAQHYGVLEDEKMPALQRVRVLMQSLVDGECENREYGRSIGCLTVNSTVELAGRDPEAGAILRKDTEQRLALLRDVIAAGQRDGEITSGRDAAALASYVNTVVGGMRVAAQGGASREELESIAATALDVLTC
ncbi:TetR/AcrR family transcriptional regulator [Amycolatopsis acidicola]|uniref:TetR/AcrR family transcriptional regulator n=1 Tax=Amycolatopsis acidicola TaxID=2596893 RepID=A0A5N0UPD0_9PSEU|nr:TetR/AcrR family transcriptional regulator [Amycolatopsis acidicola]KAA9150007.1 TetR/AcrR family transcriptional regulator [Amycolatopsis acidicola]